MSQHNGTAREGLLEQAVNRLRNRQVPAIPSGLVESTLKVIPDLPTPRKASLMSGGTLVKWSGLAATFLAVAVGTAAFFLATGPQVVVAQVLENVQKATSLEFVCTFGHDEASREHKVVIKGDRMRIQTPQGIVMTHDTTTSSTLYVDSANLAAGRFPLSDGSAAELQINPIRQFQHVSSDTARPIGEKVIEGKVTKAFRVRGARLFGVDSDRADVYVWTDPQTLLPVRIELRIGDTTLATFRNMKWNVPVDPAVLAMDIPKGYQERSEESFRRVLHSPNDPEAKLTPTEAFRKWLNKN